MPPVFKPIAVLCALVILGGRHDLDGLAICKGQHGNLASGHELFDDHLVAGCRQYFLSVIIVHTPSSASSNVLQIKTPFPSARPSAFKNDREFRFGMQIFQRILCLVEHFIGSRSECCIFSSVPWKMPCCLPESPHFCEDRMHGSRLPPAGLPGPRQADHPCRR